jgi:hypothetical protein
MVELLCRDEVAVHRDVATTVDALLRGLMARPEIRRRADDGSLTIEAPDDLRRDPMTGAFRSSEGAKREVSVAPVMPQAVNGGGHGHVAHPQDSLVSQSAGPVSNWGLRGRGVPGKPIRIYPFGVSRNRLDQAIRSAGLTASIIRDAREADLVMTLKNYYRTKPQPVRDAESRGVPVYVLRSNTIAQIQTALAPLVSVSVQREEGHSPPVPQSEPRSSGPRSNGNVVDALEEAEDAIGAVMRGMPSIALNPQAKHVRRMQHELADRYNVESRSRGKEPHRRVEIFRGGIH